MVKFKESDLFYPLSRFFSSQGYTINSEVEISKYGGHRADMILTKENSGELIGIETKTSLNFEVLDQAYFWKKYTDYNYVCVPKTKTARPKIVKKIINDLGFGLIEIDLKSYNINYAKYADNPYKILLNPYDNKVDVEKLGIILKIDAQPNHPTTRAKNHLKKVIFPEHQTWSISGQQTKGNSYVSGYKLLMKAVYDYLRKVKKEQPETDGWQSLNQIVEAIKETNNPVFLNYYSNLRSGLYQAFRYFEDGDIEQLNTGRHNEYRIMEGSNKYLDMNVRK